MEEIASGGMAVVYKALGENHRWKKPLLRDQTYSSTLFQ